MRWNAAMLPGGVQGGPSGFSGTLALPSPFPVATFWQVGVKRTVDIVLALTLLVAVAPILAVAALLIHLTDSGSILFVQRRNGQFGREFRMYKLRTMVPDAEGAQDRLAKARPGRRFLKLTNDPRVTPIGSILRKYSIDELPQLVNVLKGDMSLIGPRPLLPCDVRAFPRDERARRFDVPPGMTGLWQVSGRNAVSDDVRMDLDLRYVDEWSLSMDLEILARTPVAVLTARGAC